MKPKKKPSCLTRAFRLGLFALVSGIIILWFGMAISLSTRLMQPERIKPWATPVAAHEAVSFPSKDGLQIAAWYIPSRNRAAVIVVHGWENNRAGMLNQIEWLAKADFGVLAYDMRRHGESAGEVSTFGWSEVDDLYGALDYLSKRSDVDPEQIGAYGFSLGGQVVLNGATRDARIRAVFADEPGLAGPADEPPPDDALSAFTLPGYLLFYPIMALRTGVGIPTALVNSIGTIAPRPILLVASSRYSGPVITKRYFEAAREPRQFWQVPDTIHGETWIKAPEEYERRLIEFFSQNLLK